jgi:biopolymer transport protein ExbD
MKFTPPPEPEPELDIASLIDMVFLLLMYFMVTASLVKSEGDLGIRLPGVVQQAVTVDLPDEQIIEVREDHRVLLNGREYGHHDSPDLPQLVTTLSRFRIASDASGNKALITIAAENKTKHQRVIDVMNACAAAGIESITFGQSSD